jgi:SAM-dependent methyltransferase
MSAPVRSVLEIVAAPLTSFASRELNLTETPRARVLDNGCGSGFNERGIAFGKDTRLIGTDISFAAVRVAAAERPDARYLVADAQRLPFRDGAFDALFSHGLLQYVDPERVIGEAARVLRGGGRAVFLENLRGNPLARGYRRLHRLLRMRYMEHQTPVRHFELSKMRLFERAFDVRTFETFHLFTPLLLIGPVLRKIVLRKPMTVRWTRAHDALHRADSAVLRRVPLLRHWAWHIAVSLVRRQDV